MASDPFDDVLNLEDQYYDQGYKQGYDDGFQAGKVEGRSVGLKTGFEKFLEAGRLQSKAVVWANRISNPQKPRDESKHEQSESENSEQNEETSQANSRLPKLNENQRLEKNVTSLYALVEPGTLSTENNDEAVGDIDDRFKRAQGKLKIIERIVGEGRDKDGSTANFRPARNEI